MSVIYEKHYPHPTFEEEMEELKKCEKEWKSSPDYKPEPEMTFGEFYREMWEEGALGLVAGCRERWGGGGGGGGGWRSS